MALLTVWISRCFSSVPRRIRSCLLKKRSNPWFTDGYGVRNSGARLVMETGEKNGRLPGDWARQGVKLPRVIISASLRNSMVSDLLISRGWASSPRDARYVISRASSGPRPIIAETRTFSIGCSSSSVSFSAKRSSVSVKRSNLFWTGGRMYSSPGRTTRWRLISSVTILMEPRM
ncbi:MAG: hypothetical protein DDT30_02148 [Dehalococcoidia bacterium]|nr:hypothetical protein [Bacillota bacterium]